MSDQPVWHSSSATSKYRGLLLSIWKRDNGLTGFQWEVFTLKDNGNIQTCIKSGHMPTMDESKEAARKWVDGR